MTIELVNAYCRESAKILETRKKAHRLANQSGFNIGWIWDKVCGDPTWPFPPAEESHDEKLDHEGELVELEKQ